MTGDGQWGSFYDEFWLEIGSSLPMQFDVCVRNDTQTIYFNSRGIGLMSVQKIVTFEFDGWEVFLSSDQSVQRFANIREARAKLLTTIYEFEMEEGQ